MIRPYQNECVDAIHTEFSKGVSATLAVLATGCGKTVIVSELIRRIQPARCVFLAHRDTLIFQARATIERFAGVKCGIEMADLKADGGLFSQEQVIIGTVQTQNSGNEGLGRMNRFKPQHFDYLFLDEAHHWVAPSFRRVVDYYRINPRLKVIGFTATADRFDGQALGQLFDSTAFQYDIEDGIEDGWLVNPEQQFVPVHGLDYSHIKTSDGDLNLAQLSAVMEEEETVQRMVQPTLEGAFGLKPHRLDYAEVIDWGSVIQKNGVPKRTLVFCTSVHQAQRFAEVMNRVKSGMATAIWDKVPRQERKHIFDDFKTGALQCLVNVGICGEGFDNPGIELIVMGRATKSRSLYTQFVGRALRPLDSIVDALNLAPDAASRRKLIAESAKPTARIMDFVGNSGTHKLISLADILGGRYGEQAVELAKKKAMKKEGAVKISDLLELSEEELKRRMEKAKKLAEEKRTKLVARVEYSTINIDPFDALDISPAKPKSFRSEKKLSDGQLAFMRRFGIDASRIPYAQGIELFVGLKKRLDAGLATPRQSETLKRHGYDTRDMKYKDAKKLIDALKANGWKRPSPIDVPENF